MSEAAVETPKAPLGAAVVTFRVGGFLAAVSAWIVVGYFLGYLGGLLVGMPTGGWNFQFLTILVFAIYGAPMVGSVATIVLWRRGCGYWKALLWATLLVAGTYFVGSALWYLFIER